MNLGSISRAVLVKCAGHAFVPWFRWLLDAKTFARLLLLIVIVIHDVDLTPGDWKDVGIIVRCQ